MKQDDIVIDHWHIFDHAQHTHTCKMGPPGHKAWVQMKALTHDDYVARVEAFGHLEVIGEYVNQKTRLLFRCKRHKNEELLLPRNPQTGGKMKCCSAEEAGRARFIKAAKVYKEKCESQGRLVVVEDYKGARVPIYHFCKEHKMILKGIPNNILTRGDGLACCRSSASRLRGKRKSETKKGEYAERLAAIGKLEALEEYRGSKTKILHRCLLHDEQGLQSPEQALSGRGLICCKENIKLENFEKARWYVRNYPDLCRKLGRVKPLEEYRGASNKILHLCLRHNQQHLASPNHILRGHGLICCNDGGDSIRRFLNDEDWAHGKCHFYVAEVGDSFIKPGIASSPSDRADEEYLEFLFISPELGRAEAWTIEQFILHETSFAKPRSLPVRFLDWEGKSELREADCLDVSWIAKRFYELLEKLHESGWIDLINLLGSGIDMD